MVYFLGTTLKITLTITDYDDTAIDPDSFSIVINDPEGTAHDDSPVTSLTKEETGTHYFYLEFPSDGVAGNWIIAATVTKDSKPSVQKHTITLEAPTTA